MELDSQARLEEGAGHPGWGETEEAPGVFKVTVHEAANVTGGSSEVFGRAGMTHDIKGVSDEGKGERGE